MAKLTHLDCPDWLRAVLACPVCGSPCWRTPSGYMGCMKAGHMKLVLPDDVESMVREAFALAKARNMTRYTIDQYQVIARKWLSAQPLKEKTAPREEKTDE